MKSVFISYCGSNNSQGRYFHCFSDKHHIYIAGTVGGGRVSGGIYFKRENNREELVQNVK
jgi:hypothetical protein